MPRARHALQINPIRLLQPLPSPLLIPRGLNASPLTQLIDRLRNRPPPVLTDELLALDLVYAEVAAGGAELGAGVVKGEEEGGEAGAVAEEGGEGEACASHEH
jgi:hypothetical protein